MSLLNDILTWTETLPNWQRDAARRLLLSEEGLTVTDYDELYLLLKSEHGLPKPDDLNAQALSSAHLPAELAAGETVNLKTLRELKNVNKIPQDQSLNFSEQGITVIYGGNGSGKSGYARVMKHACRARDQSEPVHPDASDPDAATAIPSAIFDVEVGGNAEEIFWAHNSEPPDKLSAIAVFDSRCARSYLTAEQDVAYLPYGLDVVENLANVVLPELSRRLDEEIASIDINTAPYDYLHGKTAVGQQIEGLSAKSDTKVITQLGTLNDDEVKQLDGLNKALSEVDPEAKAKELRLSAMRLKAYAGKIIKPLTWVCDEAVGKLQKLTQAKTDAEEAEAKAAEALQAGEMLLPGTGTQVWKALFESARRYSTVAYPENEFPYVADPSVCPLCQEELSDAAGQRLIRFEQYVKDDVAKVASEERKKLDIAKQKIEGADLKFDNDAVLEELRQMDETLPEIIGYFEGGLEVRKQAMLDCLTTNDWDGIPNLSEDPRAKIRTLAFQQLRTARTLARTADEEKKQKLVEERDELAARLDLSKCLEAVLALLQRMNRKSGLEQCYEQLKTRSISNKSKQFASQAVTAELKNALDQEFEALGVGHIQTTLKEKNIRGRMYHQLLLDLPTARKTEEILSEGEQRAIALGAFLAELALANHSCGIVFDDPVSSLDHWRRRDVARRLVAEGQIRQVIVFTHDTSFLGQLCDEIDEAQISSSMMFLEWRGNSPGYVNEGLPWDHQGYKARINSLEQAQSQLAKTWPTYPGEEDKTQMRHEYDGLRATLERVIQDVVFNGVVKRYRDWIRVDSLGDVVGFEQSEYEEIDKLHKRCCDVITAHDPSSAKDASVPTATDLGNDIEALKKLVQAIKDRRKQTKESQ